MTTFPAVRARRPVAGGTLLLPVRERFLQLADDLRFLTSQVVGLAGSASRSNSRPTRPSVRYFHRPRRTAFCADRSRRMADPPEQRALAARELSPSESAGGPRHPEPCPPAACNPAGGKDDRGQIHRHHRLVRDGAGRNNTRTADHARNADSPFPERTLGPDSGALVESRSPPLSSTKTTSVFDVSL